MNKKLKPCPFCGGEATLRERGMNTQNYVSCTECGTVSMITKTKEEAIKAWNTRKPIDNIVEQLEECSWWTPPTYDEDGYCNDDSAEVVDLDTAIEIVEKGGQNA